MIKFTAKKIAQIYSPHYYPFEKQALYSHIKFNFNIKFLVPFFYANEYTKKYCYFISLAPQLFCSNFEKATAVQPNGLLKMRFKFCVEKKEWADGI